jgi:hypothetical protein
VSISIKDNPKFTNILDYWNEETDEKIVDLLHEYQDVLLTTFLEMKGISKDLRKIRIPINLYVKPVKQRPYRLNPVYKKKVKAKIDRMMEDRIIEHVVDSNGSI